MTIVPRSLLTHDVTITGERQVGTEDDGFGGTQPVTETPELTARGRYEPNGAQLRRQFVGEDTTDGPAVALVGHDLTEWDDAPDNDSADDGIVIDTGDAVDLDGISATYEIRGIERYSMRGGVPELVIIDLVQTD